MAAVAFRGKMTEAGYQPENAEWYDVLVKDGEGVDPLTIPVETLIAAGHPPRPAQAVFSAWGGCLVETPRRGAKGIREHCIACAENFAEVRRCTIIDCPAWPYRMGRNPHDERRGKQPVFRVSHSLKPEGRRDGTGADQEPTAMDDRRDLAQSHCYLLATVRQSLGPLRALRQNDEN